MSRLVVLTAFLSPPRTADEFDGAFAQSARKDQRTVYDIANRWAYTLRSRRHRTGAVKMHVVHDNNEALPPSHYVPDPDVELRHIRLSASDAALAASTGMSPIDQRWLAYGQLVTPWTEESPKGVSHHAAAFTSDDCVFAIDAADVGLIGNASDLCTRNPTAVIAGSDSCDVKVKGFMRRHALHAHFTLSDTLDAFLRRRALKHLPLFNAGIVGARGSVWLTFLAELSSAIRRHYELVGVRAAGRFVDMLVLNDLLLARHARGAAVVTGWPKGVVNLPMWSNFCNKGAGAECRKLRLGNRSFAMNLPPSHEPPAPEYRRCVAHKLMAMVTDSTPAYAFVHKVTWLEHGDMRLPEWGVGQIN